MDVSLSVEVIRGKYALTEQATIELVSANLSLSGSHAFQLQSLQERLAFPAPDSSSQ